MTSPAGDGDGDASGVCGKACSSGVEPGDAAGVGGGDESGVCGKASIPAPGVEAGNTAGVGAGVEMGDAAGTCPPSGNAEIAARHPTAIKTLPIGTNLLISILVQILLDMRHSPGGLRRQLSGSHRNLAAMRQLYIAELHLVLISEKREWPRDDAHPTSQPAARIPARQP